MTPAPACRPALRKGRPSKEDNAMLELKAILGDHKRLVLTVGPVLRDMSRDPLYERQARFILAQLARLTIQDANRTLS